MPTTPWHATSERDGSLSSEDAGAGDGPARRWCGPPQAAFPSRSVWSIPISSNTPARRISTSPNCPGSPEPAEATFDLGLDTAGIGCIVSIVDPGRFLGFREAAKRAERVVSGVKPSILEVPMSTEATHTRPAESAFLSIDNVPRSLVLAFRELRPLVNSRGPRRWRA